MILTEHPRPTHTFVHLADTHLPGEKSTLYGAADADGNLQTLLERLEASGLRPDALLFAGDLVDRGEPEAYARLRGIVEPVAERMGTEIVWAPGNHDEREAFRAGLMTGDAGVTGTPIRVSRRFGDLRVLVLDTTVPGQHWGVVDDEQLEWLRAELAQPAPGGTLLIAHHPPLPTVLDLAVTVELRRQNELADVILGSDVRAILSGHVHHPSFGMFAGIPVAVASSSAYGQDLAAAVGSTRGQDSAQGYNLVQVYPETIVHTPVSITIGSDVGEHVPAPEAARRIAAQGITWRS